MTQKENDFGFTFVDETEYEEYEKSLREQAFEQQKNASKVVTQLNAIMAVIRPFLTNLASDPTKKYIKWENRAAKIKEIQVKITDILES